MRTQRLSWCALQLNPKSHFPTLLLKTPTHFCRVFIFIFFLHAPSSFSKTSAPQLQPRCDWFPNGRHKSPRTKERSERGAAPGWDFEAAADFAEGAQILQPRFAPRHKTLAESGGGQGWHRRFVTLLAQNTGCQPPLDALTSCYRRKKGGLR